MDTPPSLHRSQKNLQKKMQGGTIISFTTITHPPKGFGSEPKTIGLIELSDGSRVLGQIITEKQANEQTLAGQSSKSDGWSKPEAIISVGMRVSPHLRLNRINPEGLRIYDVCYELNALKPAEIKQAFPGYIIALTGPSGVGKTTVSRLLTTRIGEYAQNVTIITTRNPSEHDKGEYEYVSQQEFEVLKKQGSLASAARIPSHEENRWYGYRRKDIESIWKSGKIPVVITEIGLLQDLVRSYGRRSILSFGLLPPGKSKRTMLSCLLHRLRERGRDTDEAIRERLKNAEKDIQFFWDTAHLFDDLIVNGNLDAVINKLNMRVSAIREKSY